MILNYQIGNYKNHKQYLKQIKQLLFVDNLH